MSTLVLLTTLPSCGTDSAGSTKLLERAVFLGAAAASRAAGERFEAPRAQMPVHTFSIVARDDESGQIGVAVASHWFAVGSLVLSAEPGVGAVVTQAFVEPAYGKRGLELMRRGQSAPETLKALLTEDSDRELRQIALIDAKGLADAFTGKRAIAAAGQQVGKNYAVAANFMKGDEVWPAMARAFEAASGDLAERLLAALEAGQNSGGDLRGKQSAALVVVAASRNGQLFRDRPFDVRVDDHPAPLRELRRLTELQRAYNHLNQGDLALAQNQSERARKEYQAAEKFAPKKDELVFWHAVALVNMKRTDEALPLLRRLYTNDKQWRTAIERLAKAGLIPDEPKLVDKLTHADTR